MDKTKYYVIGSILGIVGVTGIPVATTYIKDVSQEGLSNTAKHEGYRAKPYHDTGKVITQGYGSTIKPDGSKIKMTDKPLSKKEALQYLKAHISKHKAPFNSSLKNVKISQPEYDLYADFVYQYGIAAWLRSDMLTNLKKEKYVQACHSLESWRFSRVQPGNIKVDCRINSKCKGVWNRQQDRINKCLEVNR